MIEDKEAFGTVLRGKAPQVRLLEDAPYDWETRAHPFVAKGLSTTSLVSIDALQPVSPKRGYVSQIYPISGLLN